MAQMLERDPLLEKIESAKALSFPTANILHDIRQNGEQLARFCNEQPEKQQVEAHTFTQQVLNLNALTEQFRAIVTNQLALLTNAVEQLATEKIALWKQETRRLASGLIMTRTITLEQLQFYCIPIADVILDLYQQLQEAERILQNGATQTGNGGHLHFVETSTEDVVKLIQRFLSRAFVVEEQLQIIIDRSMSANPVVVSLLTGAGGGFSFQLNPPEVYAILIDEDQVRSLSHSDEIATAGDIRNGKVSLIHDERYSRFRAKFTNLRVTDANRTRRGINESVWGRKYYFHFYFTMILGSRTIKVSTTSLPVAVITHRSQQAFAAATITWYNAFAPMQNEAFEVPQTAQWTDVAELLQGKYRQATEGHELNEDNLAYLARKAFRNAQPQPETISFDSLCNDQSHPLPGVSFSFWTWFHGILRFIEKANLKEMCRAGLIMGFIDRESAETLVATGGPGTFLLRFMESAVGGIAIACACAVDGQVIGRSLIPFTASDFGRYTLAMRIRERETLEWLYQVPVSIPKDVAFGPFYEEEPIVF